jgi:hypothetical protein
MIHRFTNGTERWKIHPRKFDQLNRRKLSLAVDQVWKGLRLFATPEDAMRAVVHGKTGVESWDVSARGR